jgi:hypothetical protein
METLLQLLNTPFLGKDLWLWLVFAGIVVTLLGFDLGFLHKDDHEIGVKESLLLSAGYISIALLFGGWVWRYLGAQSGMAYYTGFLIEKSLSMDNTAVFSIGAGIHGCQNILGRHHRQNTTCFFTQCDFWTDRRRCDLLDVEKRVVISPQQ